MSSIYPRNWLCKVEYHRRPGELYLTRYVGFRCKWFGLYIHKFHVSDYPVPHDHPWVFLTLPLRGGYWEHFPDGTYKWRGVGIPAFRTAREFHWIDIPAGTNVWTFFMHGPKQREWGFMTDKGWINADQYQPE